MAYQTIRDLISHVRTLHGRLEESVRKAQRREDDERSTLLLKFIGEHESALERAIEAAEESGASVLDTWLQFEPNTELERAMAQSDLDSSPSSDDVVKHVLETENALVRLYELLIGSTGSSRVQSFFSSLLEMEDSAVRRSARVRLESGDI